MSKPLPILPHMPKLVKEKIVSRTNTSTRESLMNVSHEFRDLVIKTEVFEKVTLAVTEIGVSMEFYSSAGNRTMMEYFKYNNGCLVKNGDSVRVVEDKTPYNMLVRDLWKLTGNPKHSIGELLLTHNDVAREKSLLDNMLKLVANPNLAANPINGLLLPFGGLQNFLSISPIKEDTASLLDEIQRVFSQSDKLLNVIGLRFDMDQDMIFRRPEAVQLDQDAMMKVISICKPGFLEWFFLPSMRNKQDISKVIASEQWKQAKQVTAEGADVPPYAVAHLRYALVSECTMSQRDFEGIVQSAIRQGKDLRQFLFTGLTYDHQAALQYLSTYPGMELFAHEDYRIHLPDSEYKMYFTANADCLWIVPSTSDE